MISLMKFISNSINCLKSSDSRLGEGQRASSEDRWRQRNRLSAQTKICLGSCGWGSKPRSKRLVCWIQTEDGESSQNRLGRMQENWQHCWPKRVSPVHRILIIKIQRINWTKYFFSRTDARLLSWKMVSMCLPNTRQN